MNDQGWVKMHRKMLSNDALFRSSHTFTVWCWLLLNADYKTGEVTVGRFLLSAWLKIKPSTVYQTLKRLSNMNMIDTKSNNKMTTVKILNWSKYQSNPITKDEEENDEYNNKKTVIQQQSNTIQEYKNKNKEKNIYSSLKYLEDLPESDVEEFYKKYQASKSDIKTLAEALRLWCETSGKTKKNYRAFIQNRLLDKYGLRPIVVKQIVEEPYVPASADTIAKFNAERKKLLGGMVI